MLIVTLAVLILFAWAQITARLEPASLNSGTNFVFTAIMSFIVFMLASFSTLKVSIDESSLRIKFGFGIFSKKFALNQIASVQAVQNRWYYGWGVRLWFWPKMWIYNVSGFQAVQITMKNGEVYRIGTDVPEALETAIQQSIHTS